MSTATENRQGRPGQAKTMRAVVRERFGSTDVLELRDVERPDLPDDAVLVRVRAAALNPLDWYGMTGTPYFGRIQMGLRSPKERALGVDFAGIVEAAGPEVTGLEPGDEVFGGRTGALAEYVAAAKAVARKPANLTFEEAAAIPVAGITALQGLRDKGNLQAGQSVLINGASGGVGTFAVQIAKALGAEVTAVCSTAKVELVRSLGADHVIDYTREDFTRTGRRHDLILDVAGSRPWRACKRVLKPEATVVVVGAPRRGRLLGPLKHIVAMRAGSMTSSQKSIFFIADLNKDDLVALRELVEAGKVKPVLDRRYELSEAAEAFRYLGEGHARGKIVITV